MQKPVQMDDVRSQLGENQLTVARPSILLRAQRFLVASLQACGLLRSCRRAKFSSSFIPLSCASDVRFDADNTHSISNHRIECFAKNKSGLRIPGSSGAAK